MRHSNEFFSSPEMKAVDKLFIFWLLQNQRQFQPN
jgi:hypothetical protein